MFNLFKKKKEKPFISAVIAAGASFGVHGFDNEYLTLNDVPVLIHSIMQFEMCESVDELVVVCPADDIADIYAMVQDFEISKVKTVAAGRENRQASVFEGISQCSKNSEYFIIHDADRPFVTVDIIENCIEDALNYGAAIVGVPVKDTIKVSDVNGFVKHTPNREKLIIMQTPQIFKAELYKTAIKHAQLSNTKYTDDCQLIENLGRNVFISQGSYENIKITAPEDIAYANAILALRQGGWGFNE